MALRRGINSDSVIHVCKEAGLFLLLADIMSRSDAEKGTDDQADHGGETQG